MNLRWRLARLRRMRPTEPAARLWTVARRAWHDGSTGLPGERLQPLPWFHAPPLDPQHVIDAVHRTGIPLLSHHVDPDLRRAWDRDPRSGQRWPTDINGQVTLLGTGLDPRETWELGRLQHLALLAAVDPEDPAPLDDARDLRQQHPVGHGLPWASTLEVALRLVSLGQIAASRSEPDLRLMIAEHAQWLWRWPSVGSSARNHRVAELAALAVAAWLLPDAADQAQWAREAATLPAILDQQIHRDGVGVEQSTHYLAFVVEWGLVARSVGVADLDGPLVGAVRFLSALLDSSGANVRLGDADDGRVIAAQLGPETDYVTSVVGAAASVLGIPAPACWTPDRRSQLLASEPAPQRNTPGTTSFPEGGLTVFREGARLVVMDHGPVGEPDLSAHGHADALAVHVHVDGPVIGGRGTGRYHDPGWRRFCRTTGAHPTVLVDGMSQSDPHDHPFLWRHRARTTLHELDLDRRHVVASHDGYLRRLGVVHRRHLELSGNEILLEDAVLGMGTHEVAVLLPLAPGIRARPTAEGIEIRRGQQPLLMVTPDPRCDVRPVKAGPQPGIGHHSPAYGQSVAAGALSLEVRGRLPLELITRIRFLTPASDPPQA